MKKITRILTIAALVIIVCGLTTTVFAANKTKKAKNAYYKALKNGSIDTDTNMWCALKDVDKNGIPELLIYLYGTKHEPCFYLYTYKNGKVVQLVKHNCEYTMYYNEKKHIFSEVGEGGGGWRIDYKLKKGKLVEIVRYEGYAEGGNTYQYKVVGSKKTPISREKYMTLFNGAEKDSCLVKMSKSKLKKMLKN